MGKKLLVSDGRQSVRGTVIFLLTHALLLLGITFTAVTALILLGMADVYIPGAGRLIGLIQ